MRINLGKLYIDILPDASAEDGKGTPSSMDRDRECCPIVMPLRGLEFDHTSRGTIRAVQEKDRKARKGAAERKGSL